jgi:hypothetical protein
MGLTRLVSCLDTPVVASRLHHACARG